MPVPPDQMIQFTAKSADLLAAMANEKRIVILDLVTKGETRVQDISGIVGLSQSATSQHLALLRKAGLVETRRDAQTIYYSSSSASVAAILGTLRELFSAAEHGQRREAA